MPKKAGKSQGGYSSFIRSYEERTSWFPFPLVSGFCQDQKGRLMLFDNSGRPLRSEDAIYLLNALQAYLGDWEIEDLDAEIEALGEKERKLRWHDYTFQGLVKAHRKRGYIYVCFRSSDGLRKIGLSGCPSRRVRGIKGAVLEREFPVTNMAYVEARVHEHFEKARKEGEWFEITPEDVNTIPDVIDAIENELRVEKSEHGN